MMRILMLNRDAESMPLNRDAESMPLNQDAESMPPYYQERRPMNKNNVAIKYQSIVPNK